MRRAHMRRARLTPFPPSLHTVAAHVAAIYAERDAFVTAVHARRRELDEALPAEVRGKGVDERERGSEAARPRTLPLRGAIVPSCLPL